MNFNIVQKPKKKDDEDIMDEDEMEVEERGSSSSDAAAKKRMIKFMLIIVAVTVVLLLILYVASLFSHRSYTYEEVETIMKEAAESYFKDHPESLPMEDGSIVEIDSSNLVVAEKMKALSEYTGEVLCTGSVQVEKSGSEYLYTPYLNCGDTYATVEFYNKVLSSSEIVTSGYGLYSHNGSYAFRGESVNNYVKLGKSLWRIVKITSNNNIVLIHEEGISFTEPWDDRYNEERLYEAGINTYSASRVKEYLEKVYSNPDENYGEDILSSGDKAKMVSFSVCTGKRAANSESKDNTEECSEVLQNQRMGLLTLSDYLYASVDPNCISASTKSCKNYNYLSKSSDWWLVTANKEDTSTVFKVGQNGVVSADTAANYAMVRPVITLNSKVLYKSGNGSFEKPYKVR